MSVITIQPVVQPVRVVAYPWKLPAADVTPLIKAVSIKEDAERAGLEATLEIDDDAGFSMRNLAPGTWLQMSVMDPATQRWISPAYELYVWDRAMTDMYTATSTCTAFDIVSFLQRQGARPYLWKKKTASEIAGTILRELGIDHLIVETIKEIPFVHLQSATPFEMIVAAYTEDRKTTAGVRGSAARYRYKAVGRTFVIERLLLQGNVWEVSQGSNLSSASWRESLEGTATEVRAISVDSETRRLIRSAKATSSMKERYGLLTETISYSNGKTPAQLTNLAKARLKQVSKLDRSASVQAEGIPTLHATDAVIIRDEGTGMKGRFYITSVQHDFGPNGHTMSLDLSYVAVVPDRPITEAERDETVTPGQHVTVGPDGRPVVSPELAELYPEATSDLPTRITTNSEIVAIPLAYAWDRPVSDNGPVRTQARFIPVIVELTVRHNLKVGNSLRPAAYNARINGADCSDHIMGCAADFYGSQSDMIALERYARKMVGIRFAYVDGPELNTDGNHGDHVHISFVRCGCNAPNAPILSGLYPTTPGPAVSIQGPR